MIVARHRGGAGLDVICFSFLCPAAKAAIVQNPAGEGCVVVRVAPSDVQKLYHQNEKTTKNIM